MQKNLIELNDHNFENFLLKNENVFIDFYATWCGPCKMILPVIELASSDDSIKTTFAKVDVDEAPHFAAIMNIRTVPSLFFFKNANPVQFKQNITKDNIINFIKSNE